MRQIPGIAGRAEQPRFRGRHQPELRLELFAEDRNAGIEEALGEVPLWSATLLR